MGHLIRVRAGILVRLVEEAQRMPHQECCGLLAGAASVITHIFPAANALESATEYEIAPLDLFRLFREMRAAGLDHLGIYHSHPRGENYPSARDVERAYYPDVAYFILSPRPNAPRPVRAFSIRDGNVSELPIESVEQDTR
jgi:[CysO sulfur-carrier protein]-S-L-cysteine hydrolase